MEKIRTGMILGPYKDLHIEPIMLLFEGAQARYGYISTQGN